MDNDIETRERIVNTALQLADAGSWESLRLHELAAACDLGLADIRGHFREKEEIAEAWFDRADRAVCAAADTASLSGASPGTRFGELIDVWLDTLSAHRQVAREIVLSKFEPGHIHFQIQGLLRVSRTVQLLRDAAGYKTVLPWRAFGEIDSTRIYLAAFARWLCASCGEMKKTTASRAS